MLVYCGAECGAVQGAVQHEVWCGVWCSAGCGAVQEVRSEVGVRWHTTAPGPRWLGWASLG